MKSKFWGIQVNAKKSQFVCPGNGELIRISQIALGDGNFESAKHVVVYLIADGRKMVLARLSAEHVPQLSVDIILETHFRIVNNWKDGRVDICGYIVNQEEDDAADRNGSPAILPNIKATASEPGSSAKIDDYDLDEDHVEDFSDDESLEKLDDEDVDEDVVADLIGVETPKKFGDDYLDEDQVDDVFEDETETTKKVESSIEVPQKTDGKQRTALTESSPFPSKKSKKETAAEIPELSAEFPCQLCSKTFKLEKGLEYHVKAKHEEASAHTATRYRVKKSEKKTVEIQLSCEFCSKIFKSQAALGDHSKAKHGKE